MDVGVSGANPVTTNDNHAFLQPIFSKSARVFNSPRMEQAVGQKLNISLLERRCNSIC